MTAIFNAGFDGCSAGADIALYPFSSIFGSSYVSFVTGAYGNGKAAKFAGAYQNCYVVYTFSSTQAGKTLIFGFDFSYTTTTTANQAILVLMDSSTAQLALVLNTNTRQLEVRLGSYNSTLIAGAVSTISLLENIYYYIEFKVLVHDSAGTLELKINGQTQFTLTGKDTQASSTDAVSNFKLGIETNFVPATNTIDNFYCLNTDGSAPWNTYLGQGYVSRIVKPDGDSSVQFTSSSGGANYTNIDDDMSAWVASTDNNNSSTLNHTDVFTLQTLSAVNNVAWLSTLCRAKRDVAGARSLSVGIDSGGTIQQVEHSLGSDYITYQDIFTTSDGASTTFTQSTIDSLLGRYKITV